MTTTILLDEGAPRPRSDLPLNPRQRHLGRECRRSIRGPNGRLLCRWCGTETKPPRLTFCGEKCVHEWKMRTSGSYARRMVFQRDRGICACCKVDTLAIADALMTRWSVRFTQWCLSLSLGSRLLSERQRAAWRKERDRINKQRVKLVANIHPGYRAAVRAGREDLWDADHIVTVIDGGGQCGLDNYQTLCVVCHLDKSTGRSNQKAGPVINS